MSGSCIDKLIVERQITNHLITVLQHIFDDQKMLNDQEKLFVDDPTNAHFFKDYELEPATPKRRKKTEPESVSKRRKQSQPDEVISKGLCEQ